MNTIERTSLLLNREELVFTVGFDYIKDNLLAYGLLQCESLEDIENQKTNQDKIRRLLDILPNVEHADTFTTFTKILEEDYDWIADTLRKPNKALDSPDASSARNGHPFDNGCKVIHDQTAESIQKSLIFGGVPFPPVQLIPRVEKVEEVRSLLRKLKNGEFIIIHGMAGAGKSVLATQAVRDSDLLRDYFECNVHWLTIGRTDKDSLLTKMQALCERLDHGQTVLPLSIDQATERLRKLFMENNRRKSLLVLDDVWRGEVIRAFDVGCKILLTTRDISISKTVQGRGYSVKLNDGFTKMESLTYLANSLNLNLQHLPIQAHDIYQESKGSPMVLSLLVPLLAGSTRFNSLLRDRTQRPGNLSTVDVQRWDHNLKVLRDRGYTRKINHNSEYYDTIDEAIAMSINDLTGDAKEAFYDFVIFLDDVNIPAAVLQVLWNCSSYEMEERVGPLIAKSLLVQHVQEEASGCTVLYGVHDLLLDHLKSSMDANQQTIAHRKLVNAYIERYKGDYSAIPNDNYIYWFLGYHLYKAEFFDKFPNIYLNLPFISAKIKATRPSDLLNDFRKYQDYIIGKDGEHLKRTEDYANFVRAFSDVVVQNERLDIVQLALQQPKNSCVYEDGLSLAKSSRTGTYFECIPPNGQTSEDDLTLRSTLLNYGIVTAACFTNDSRYVLSAISDGQIRLWEADSGKELHSFIGHQGVVHNLALSNNGSRFVSSSGDRSAKIWDLVSVTSQFLGIENRSAKTPSPRIRQDSWHNMFDIAGQVKSDNSLTTYCGHGDEVLGAWFSENGALVISCSLDKTARIWLSTAGMEMGVLNHPETVTTACFANSGLYVATGCDDSLVRLWSALSYLCLATFRRDGPFSRVLFLRFCDENSLISVSDTELLKFDWDFKENSQYVCSSLCEPVTDICYQCATICTNNQYLALASSKDSVILYNVSDMAKVYNYTGHTGAITCLSFSFGSDQTLTPMLLSGSHDETVKVWNVKDFEKLEETLLFSTVLSAVSPVSQPNSLIAVLGRSDNHLQVKNMESNEVLLTFEAGTPPDCVALCSLSHSSGMLCSATHAGRVQLTSVSRNESKVLGHHSDAKVSLLKFSLKDSMILSGDVNGCIKVWKPNLRCISIAGPSKGVLDCFFSNDESKLLVCGIDGSVQFWCLEKEQPLAAFGVDSECLTCVDKADIDDFLAQGTADKGVLLWKLDFADASAKRTTRNSLGKEKNSPARTCRFSKTSQHLAVGYDNGSIDIFDYTTGSLIASLNVHRSWVRDLQWCSSSVPFQLVSAGDRIVFLNFMMGAVTRSIPSLAAASRSVNALRPAWQQVSVSVLQTVELGGRFAHKIFLSQDGKTATVLLSSGSYLSLRLIRNADKV